MSEPFDESQLPAWAVRSEEETELHAAMEAKDEARIAAIRGLIDWRHAQFEDKLVPDKGAYFVDGMIVVTEASNPITSALSDVTLEEQWRVRGEWAATWRQQQIDHAEWLRTREEKGE